MDHLIVGLGELLWDILPSGRKIGGAPSNFVVHARALGADAHLISRIGSDSLGKEILSDFASHCIPADAVQVDADHPTGTVAVNFGANGQPDYHITQQVAWDFIEADLRSRELCRNAAVLCFGSLAQRHAASRNAIRELVHSTGPEALRIFDVNFRNPLPETDTLLASLGQANVLKLNDHELPTLFSMLDLRVSDERSAMVELQRLFDLKGIAITRGRRGCALLFGNDWIESPAIPCTVVDTVGAGDAFTAALAVGLLRQRPLDLIASHANELAAYVCTQAGATPPIPESLIID